MNVLSILGQILGVFRGPHAVSRLSGNLCKDLSLSHFLIQKDNNGIDVVPEAKRPVETELKGMVM